MNILIVGAGFSGTVIAEQLSKKIGYKILLIDERNHIGGNCYTERDESTGIMIHNYGPHIFNTDNEKVWNYICKFCEMIPYVNRVKAVYNGNIYSWPMNLHTINQFFGKIFKPDEAQIFLNNIRDTSIDVPNNFEEQALKMLGKDLYKAFFYGYTKKQWGCEPKQLQASILKRLPIRFNYNDNYYLNHLQGIPKEGYTKLFQNMLDHPNIKIMLNTKFDKNFSTKEFDHIFYTGPIDAFFNYKYGRLGYRTVIFKREDAIGDYQGNAVINYTDPEIPYTRIHEHKHFTPWENHEKTVYFKEYSKETLDNDVPFYPKRLKSDIEKLDLYQNEVNQLSNYTFLGRLATYRYLDMHHVINDALDICAKFKTSHY